MANYNFNRTNNRLIYLTKRETRNTYEPQRQLNTRLSTEQPILMNVTVVFIFIKAVIIIMRHVINLSAGRSKCVFYCKFITFSKLNLLTMYNLELVYSQKFNELLLLYFIIIFRYS